MKLESQKKAVSLRKNGESIKGIATLLKVSQGTVSRWCKEIKLSEKQRKFLEDKRKRAGLAALTPWIEKNKKLKKEDLRVQKAWGEKDVGKLTRRDLLFLGLGLYWGEGYKRGSDEWGFTNSDPAVIRMILTWVNECYAVNLTRVHARLTINELYTKEVLSITKDWSKETGIPVSDFSSPSIIRGYGKVTKNKRTYRGTLRIKIRSGTSLRRRILASIDSASNQISPCSRNTAS